MQHTSLEYFSNTVFVTINLYSTFQRAQEIECSHTFSFILKPTEIRKDRYIWQYNVLKVAMLGKEIVKNWQRKTD